MNVKEIWWLTEGVSSDEINNVIRDEVSRFGSCTHKLLFCKPTEGLGINIPATTTMFVGTKHDIRKGRNIGSPVSGWTVESTTTSRSERTGIAIHLPVNIISHGRRFRPNDKKNKWRGLLTLLCLPQVFRVYACQLAGVIVGDGLLGALKPLTRDE